MRKKVYYTMIFKSIAVAMFGFSFFVCYAALHASDDQTLIAFLVAGFFILGSGFLLYQAFFVYFEYDDEALYFGKKREKLIWQCLVEKGYSSLMDMNYLVFDGFGKIWVSSYMFGVDELDEFLEHKTQKLDDEGA